GNKGLTWHLGATYIGPVHVKNNLAYGFFDEAPFLADNSITSSGQLVMNYNGWTNLHTNTRTYQWAGTFHNRTSFLATTSNQYDFNGRADDNPQFVNIASRDFHLQGTSPVIDRGGPLTTTRSAAATPTTTLPVF